jgi:O-methyltransferase domain
MRDWLIAETDTPHWQAWGQLYEGVRSGQTVVPQLFGVHIYEYYAAHSEDRACFSRAMSNISGLVAQGTVQHYDFSRTRHIMDVGGADGGLLLAILDVNPEVRGTVFDQPHVVEAARQAIHAKNYQARCEVVGGEFLSGGAFSGPLRAQVHLGRLEGRGRVADSAKLPDSRLPGRQAARDWDDDPGRQSSVCGAAIWFEHVRDDWGGKSAWWVNMGLYWRKQGSA